MTSLLGLERRGAPSARGFLIPASRTRNETTVTNFLEWKDRIAWSALSGLIIGGVSWASWVSIRMQDSVSHKELEDMVEVYAPYTKDRAMIQTQLDSIQMIHKDLVSVIDRNTSAIQQIDRSLVRISTIVEENNKP